MTDDMDRQIDMEMQRSRMQELLRNCDQALMIVVSADGSLVHAYMNLSPIERRGLAELITDGAPRFYEDDEDEEEEG